MTAPVSSASITRMDGGHATGDQVILVTEEPLEIRLGHGPLDDRREMRLSVTMRTPGQDAELAMGFLFTEGIISGPEQLLRVAYCEDVKTGEQGNVVRAELHPSVVLDTAKLQRNFYTASSCGVCGKSSIDAVHVQCRQGLVPFGPLDPAVITALPDRMRDAQAIFKHTGGIHAAALFDHQGKMLLLCEDVGRHNAVDKVIGAALSSHLPPATCQLLVSGRAGFELVQKCVVAGIPLMAAVGAPSSLAVQLAQASGLTLIGFLRGDRFNIYTGHHGLAATAG
ncbi:MAG: formate dehydrogenase accessory sulfurtransferase FdhD [Flavobacteriales bacterium]|nr:formate dehydrogenase accessory sulfurtransferase FdhD [Flavobacteriales bacterium]MBP9078916.1 formate dehydrogenase accessory sulfurtransferase FdhD [Flavobacteriales bacterium]